MKKILGRIMTLVLILAMMFALVGCDFEEYYIISEDGTIETHMVQYYSESEFKSMLAMYFGPSVSVLTPELLDGMLSGRNGGSKFNGYLGMVYNEDGVPFFALEADSETDSFNVDQDPDSIVSPTEVKIAVGEFDKEKYGEEYSDEDIAAVAEMLNIYLDFTLPYEIVCTNGVLSEDKKEVLFWMDLFNEDTEDLEYLEYYAYTAKSDKIITLDSVNEDNCTKSDKISVFSYDGIKSVLVNGEEKLTAPVSKEAKESEEKSLLCDIETKDEGKYEIKVATEHAEKTFNVVKDTKAPKITGVKNKQTYNKNVTIKFSDATSGIKSATLNGKEIKTGKKVTKNGKYTLIVTDKAGNQKKMTFTIKK